MYGDGAQRLLQMAADLNLDEDSTILQFVPQLRKNIGALMIASEQSCLLCERTAYTRHEAHPGYQEPHTYAVHHCSHCNTAFVTPCEVDHQIYDQIYQKIGDVPGYERYLRYANQVLHEKDP